MRTTTLFASATLLLFFSAHPVAQAHCQIPCGVYTDGMRFDMIEEHIKTIEKSMLSIEELSKEGDKNYNQLIRWVDNKDQHAQAIQDIVHAYFLTQRVKPVADSKGKEYNDYVESLKFLHQLLVHAMQAKQTTDQEHVKQLRALLADYKKLYFKEHGHGH